jgi:hypothetical protein
MTLTIPRPGPQYTMDVATRTKQALETEDLRNRKAGADVELSSERLIIRSPNGTRYEVVVDNNGGLYAGSAVASGHATPIPDPFASGTKMLFIQAAAPTGWTRVATFDDAILRIVGSAAPSSGGSNGFVAAFNSQTGTGTGVTGTGTSGGYVLQIADIPGHTHTQQSNTVSNQSPGSLGYMENTAATVLLSTNPTTTASTGGGGSHSHSVPSLTVPSLSITTSIKYVDALIASKN